jgi:hypothetical protein
MRMTEQETSEWTVKYDEWAKNCLDDFKNKFGKDSTTMTFIGALEALKMSMLKRLVRGVEE